MSSLILPLLFVFSCSWTQQPEQPPPPPPPPPIEYLGSWGARGSDPGQLQFPVIFTTDAKGSVFILDNPPSSAFVHKYDAEGRPLLTFAVPGSKHPRGIAVDSGGAIYTGDTLGSVHIFLPDGKPYRTLRSGGGRGLGLVTGLAVDVQGNLYVADSSGCRIVKFNPHLRFAKSWGKRGGEPGELNYPSHLAVGQDAGLYVVEDQNQRVQQFTPDGIVQSSWPFPVAGPPTVDSTRLEDKDKMAFYGLSVSQKYVAVLDGARGLLHFWTPAGQMQQSVSLAGRQELGESAVLADIAWAPRGDLLVLDAANAKVLRYRVNF